MANKIFEPGSETIAQGGREGEGLLITFEGGEGSGKSTQINKLKQYLEEQGREVLVTREPGGTPVGNSIREILLDPDMDMSAMSEALLLAADRAEHVRNVIGPALERGTIVISDRYIDSSLAYQGVGRRLGLEAVRNLNSWATGELWPDLTFYLEVPPEVGLGRVSQDPDRIEREDFDFHDNVRHGFRMLSRIYAHRIVVLDGTAGVDEVHNRIVNEVKERL